MQIRMNRALTKPRNEQKASNFHFVGFSTVTLDVVGQTYGLPARLFIHAPMHLSSVHLLINNIIHLSSHLMGLYNNCLCTPVMHIKIWSYSLMIFLQLLIHGQLSYCHRFNEAEPIPGSKIKKNLCIPNQSMTHFFRLRTQLPQEINYCPQTWNFYTDGTNIKFGLRILLYTFSMKYINYLVDSQAIKGIFIPDHGWNVTHL